MISWGYAGLRTDSQRVWSPVPTALSEDMRSKIKRLELTSGPNPLPPTNMTPSERRGELVRLLALGLVRMNARQSSELFAETENSFVDLPLNQSGHATPTHRRSA